MNVQDVAVAEMMRRALVDAAGYAELLLKAEALPGLREDLPEVLRRAAQTVVELEQTSHLLFETQKKDITRA